MIHFLSGLPRSGSTVLSSILKQNPNIYVSSTSPTIELINKITAEIRTNNFFYNNQYTTSKEYLTNICNGILQGIYKNKSASIVIDKNRDWVRPDIIENMREIFGGIDKVKIIATVRNIPDCAASFVKVAKPDSVSLINFLENNQSSQLMSFLTSSYVNMWMGYSMYPNCFHFVEYEDLLADPKKEIKKIHDFLNLPYFDYDFNNIQTPSKDEENDNMWSIPGLHKIGNQLKKQHNLTSKEILKEYYDRWCLPEFWKLNFFEKHFHELQNKPITPIINLIELGEKKKAYMEFKKISDSNSLPVKFLQGYNYIENGDLKKGLKIFNSLRAGSLFYKALIEEVQGRYWDGSRNKTVAVYFEGSEGDQIYYARFLKMICEISCKVIVLCSENLIDIFNNIDNKIVAINYNFSKNVLLGAKNILSYEYFIPASNLPYFFSNKAHQFTKPYIKRHEQKNCKELKIGIVLEENIFTKYNNSLYKLYYNPEFFIYLNFNFLSKNLFNYEVFSNRLKNANIDAKYFSLLQKPEFLEKNLVKEISKCNLIITVSSDVCHLAGAMGIETWYISPYFAPYLLSSNTLKQYNKMKIFKQSKIDCWDDVIDDVVYKLLKRLK
jgi:sulfotransferase